MTDKKQATLDMLPSLIGAIDRTFVTETGSKTAFMIVAFLDDGAVHGTNIHPVEDAVVAMKALMAGWDAS